MASSMVSQSLPVCECLPHFSGRRAHKSVNSYDDNCHTDTNTNQVPNVTNMLGSHNRESFVENDNRIGKSSCQITKIIEHEATKEVNDAKDFGNSVYFDVNNCEQQSLVGSSRTFSNISMLGNEVTEESRYLRHNCTIERNLHHVRTIAKNVNVRDLNLREKLDYGEDCSTIQKSTPPYPEPSQTHRLAKLVGAPLPAPSWMEISLEILPAAARELLSTSLNKLYRTAHLTYMQMKWTQQYSDYGNNATGYFQKHRALMRPASDNMNSLNLASSSSIDFDDLPHFSSLPWIDRQMVKEWRTYYPNSEDQNKKADQNMAKDVIMERMSFTGEDELDVDDEQDVDFDHARTLVPAPLSRPAWDKSDVCYECHRTFGPALLRHHCRLCGHSYCHTDSCHTRKLPQLGYHPDIAERVCGTCADIVWEHNLMERIAWRLARCRDYFETMEADRLRAFTPYFEIGIDSVEEKAYRIAQAAITMAKSIPLGAQATVAVETADVLRKYGLSGIYTIMLRQEFLAAADLLRKALGINRTAWPLSVHELSAAIFYALAQHRAMRGLYPDRENAIHATLPVTTNGNSDGHDKEGSAFSRTDDDEEPIQESIHCSSRQEENVRSTPSTFKPVCEEVPDHILSALIFHAPLALNFIYLEKEVDMQLLAAQQGWRMVYAYLKSELDGGIIGTVRSGVLRNSQNSLHDRPSSALFVHEEQKLACISIRGTSTIHDVVTDIRQLPVPFPDCNNKAAWSSTSKITCHDTGENEEDEWTAVTCSGKGVAVAGMACAAMNLYREHIDSLLVFAQQGYRIRLVGHSLGGAVAALLGVLVHIDLKSINNTMMRNGVNNFKADDDGELKAPLRVYAYGTPSCVDAQLSEVTHDFVVSVVLHDDVVPRLSPTACRGLLKHLLHIRETWVKTQFPNDVKAFADRAKTVWAPRWRSSFTLTSATSSSISFKRYCRKQIQNGKKQLQLVRTKLSGEKEPGQNASPQTTYSMQYRSFEDGRRSYLNEENDAADDQEIAGTNIMELSIEAGEEYAPYIGQHRLVMDCMGSATDGGIVIDGDEFFDTDAVLDDSIEEDTFGAAERTHKQHPISKSDQGTTSIGNGTSPVKSVANILDKSAIMYSSFANGISKETVGNEDDIDCTEAVVLDEIPLPKMYVPGKIVHIYSHRGVYKAALVPKTFRDLRRISMAGNMLSDHKTKSYYDALLEVRSVRRAVESAPIWTAFDEDYKCSCCANRFTWASTSDSEAQEARDKHNCRSCGALVCHPCSENRVPIPTIGLTASVRVCDRCYYNDLDETTTTTGGLDTTGSSTINAANTTTTTASTSFDHNNSNTCSSGMYPDDNQKRVRQRAKQSILVDDLTSRVQSSPFPFE